MAGFGWSVGDIISGIKLVWDVWQALSDGPLSAQVEATQFFEDFSQIMSCLEQWDRKEKSTQEAEFSESHRQHVQLKEECNTFLQRHMRLMQDVNPGFKAIQEGKTSWSRKVEFTKEQAISLYQKMQWPFEREAVARLREKLQLHLHVVTYQVSASTHDEILETKKMVRDMRAFIPTQADLLAANLKLVSSHLDLVSLVTFNLKRVTNPLESGRQDNQIDYPMLEQFSQALLPPAPIRPAIEARQEEQGLGLPIRTSAQRLLEQSRYVAVEPPAAYDRNAGPFDHNDFRGVLSRRLDNLSMRRVETIDTISSTQSVEPLLQRLQDMRYQIVDAVGIRNRDTPKMELGATRSIPINPEPQSALAEELLQWNQLEQLIQYDLLHPGYQFVQPAARTAPTTTAASRSSVSISPLSTSPPRALPLDGWFGSMEGIPNSADRPLPSSRTTSVSSSSSPPSIRLGYSLPCVLQYGPHANKKVNATIQSIKRFDDGEVQSITAYSQDRTSEFRHSVDLNSPSAVETSMKPFLDNVHVDKEHKFRVQFQGSHNLKITKIENQAQAISRYKSPPIYTFRNKFEFLEFQNLLLNKEVKFCADFNVMKNLGSEVQGRLSTISILLDPNPIKQTRSILYFRKTSDLQQIPRFVEWPVNLFKPPKKPRSTSKLTLESHDGKPLSASRGLARRSTNGSVTTIASFESESAAFSRLPNRPREKPIIGLVVDFHEASDCLKFWEEFTTKEIVFNEPGLSGPGEPT